MVQNESGLPSDGEALSVKEQYTVAVLPESLNVLQWRSVNVDQVAVSPPPQSIIDLCEVTKCS